MVNIKICLKFKKLRIIGGLFKKWKLFYMTFLCKSVLTKKKIYITTTTTCKNKQCAT